MAQKLAEKQTAKTEEKSPEKTEVAEAAPSAPWSNETILASWKKWVDQRLEAAGPQERALLESAVECPAPGQLVLKVVNPLLTETVHTYKMAWVEFLKKDTGIYPIAISAEVSAVVNSAKKYKTPEEKLQDLATEHPIVQEMIRKLGLKYEP